MSSTLGSEQWNEGLKLVSYCPVCETRYNPMEARLLGEQGETQLLHVQCRKCRHSILALVLVNQMGASSVGLLTDLSYEDVMRSKAHTAVTVDDVIQVHTLFEGEHWEQRLGRTTTEQINQTRKKRKRLQEQAQ